MISPSHRKLAEEYIVFLKENEPDNESLDSLDPDLLCLKFSPKYIKGLVQEEKSKYYKRRECFRKRVDAYFATEGHDKHVSAIAARTRLSNTLLDIDDSTNEAVYNAVISSLKRTLEGNALFAGTNVSFDSIGVSIKYSVMGISEDKLVSIGYRHNPAYKFSVGNYYYFNSCYKAKEDEDGGIVYTNADTYCYSTALTPMGSEYCVPEKVNAATGIYLMYCAFVNDADLTPTILDLFNKGVQESEDTKDKIKQINDWLNDPFNYEYPDFIDDVLMGVDTTKDKEDTQDDEQNN